MNRFVPAFSQDGSLSVSWGHLYGVGRALGRAAGVSLGESGGCECGDVHWWEHRIWTSWRPQLEGSIGFDGAVSELAVVSMVVKKKETEEEKKLKS